MQQFEIIVKTLHGLEPVLAKEIEQLGGKDIIEHNRAVSYRGDKRLLYMSNLSLRTALRILLPIEQFKARNENVLYKNVYEIDWGQYFGVKDTFAVDSVVNSKFFSHSKYVALKVKDAIVDQFRKKHKRRPSIDLQRPTVRLNIHINNDHCTLSLDSSGDSLHKRGYRVFKNIAPLNEALAAGMVMLSGWDGKGVFIDPMCGSGTILIEAAMIANEVPPSFRREYYGFTGWKDFDRELLSDVQADLRNKMKANRYMANIIGSDISAKALNMAKKNLSALPFAKKVNLLNASFESFTPPAGDGLAIMNPPYGERMQKEDINAFYAKIGDTLKQKWAGYNVWILSANKEAIKHIGLRPSKKHTLFNGPLECKFLKYEMYKGSRKLPH